MDMTRYNLALYAVSSAFVIVQACGGIDHAAQEIDASADALPDLVNGEAEGTSDERKGSGNASEIIDSGFDSGSDSATGSTVADPTVEGGSFSVDGATPDANAPTCNYDCVPEVFCNAADGVVRNDLSCSDSKDVCCAEKPACTYGCMSTSLCLAAKGVEHTDMECTDSDKTCCEVKTTCSYNCVSGDDCTAALGEVHTDMTCESSNSVCCEPHPACVYDCVTDAICDTASGIVHADMVCDQQDSVCCEPKSGENRCPYPSACIADSSCEASSKLGEYTCLNTGDVCCDVNRCEQNEGVCRPDRSMFKCASGEIASSNYFCNGNQVCCMPNT